MGSLIGYGSSAGITSTQRPMGERLTGLPIHRESFHNWGLSLPSHSDEAASTQVRLSIKLYGKKIEEKRTFRWVDRCRKG